MKKETHRNSSQESCRNVLGYWTLKWLAETRRKKKSSTLENLCDQNPHRSNAYFLASTINFIEVVVGDIQGMDRVTVSTEVESYVEVLTTRNKPPLILCIIICTTNASVNCIWYVSRNLRESESAQIISTTRSNRYIYLTHTRYRWQQRIVP